MFWHLSLNVQGKPGNAPKGISYITSHDTGFGVLSPAVSARMSFCMSACLHDVIIGAPLTLDE
jgi:hypothetical protein